MKVSLYLRARVADGSRHYLVPSATPTGKLKPFYAMVDGNPQYFPGSAYSLRYKHHGKRVWEDVGSDPQVAMIQKHKREKIISAVSSGIEVFDPRPAPKAKVQRSKLLTVIDTYLQDTDRYKAAKTHTAYDLALRQFMTVCKKDNIEDIDRRDILNYMESIRRSGASPRTTFNKISVILTFLKKQGRPSVLHPSDVPKYTEKIVKAYSRGQLEKLFSAADREDFELFHFFLGTGCRDNEVVHACWRDLDIEAKTFYVSEKPEFGFRIKDRQERIVPISDSLVSILHGRRKRYPDTELIFPGPSGRPNNHLIRRLKKLALKAGLNCGRCTRKNGLCCKDSPVCAEWDLHRFRKTFATFHAEAGVSVHTLTSWLGHGDLETVLSYLATGDPSSPKVREQVNRTFSFINSDSTNRVSTPEITPEEIAR